MKRSVALALTILLAALTPARAETDVIKIGKQYGLPYIQFVIMEDGKLIEKHAKLQGLGDIKVEWATLGGPAQINDGIISGAIDVGAVGLPNLITMWEKTRTFTLVRVLSHIVMRFGRPTAPTSIAPEMMRSLSCAGPPSVAQFTLISPRPCSRACFSISFWSSMMTNWI